MSVKRLEWIGSCLDSKEHEIIRTLGNIGVSVAFSIANLSTKMNSLRNLQ